MDLAEMIQLLVKGSIMLAVFGLGLKASWQDVAFPLHNPGLLLRSVIAMNVIMPFIAVGVSALLEISRPVETALLVMMVSPVPPVLPSNQMKLGCEPAYIYGLLTAQAMLAVFLVPLSVWLAGRYYGVEINMAPAAVAQIVLLTILLPLAAGIGVRTLLPNASGRPADLIVHLAFLLLALGLLPILVIKGRDLLDMVGNGTLLAMALVAIFGLAVGHVFGGPETDQRGTLALATAMRHPGVALAIVAANQGDVKNVSAAVLLYLLATLVMTMLYMKWFTHRRATHPG